MRGACRPAALAVAALVAYAVSSRALARENRRLLLRSVATAPCDLRNGERVVQSIGFGPEAPDGYLSASLDWHVPDSTRLFFTVETKAGRFRDDMPLRLPSEMKHVDIQTIAVDAGVLVFGLVGHYGKVSDGNRVCDFAFTACRLSPAGAPACSPVRVVAEGQSCPNDESWLVRDGPGHAQLLGRRVSWEAGSIRPLPGPLPAEVERDWGQPGHVWFSRFHGVKGLHFVSAPDDRQHRIVLETPAGCFWDGRWVTPLDGIRLPPRQESVTVALDKRILNKILLVTWSWGVGYIDPPESSYTPCRFAFMACVLDESLRPSCSKPVVAAKARHCRPDKDEYEVPWEAPAAELSPDGTGFSMLGRHYTIVRPAR